MAYQSFPWENGDSESQEKLARLYLPSLAGKSVLDVGCNAGFFCGFASFSGAKKVVGVDVNPDFVATARELFPTCEFKCANWLDLDETKYDVILFLSAIHYAPDQQAMLDFLMAHLNPGGLLVLEIGVAPGDKDEFVEVRRAIDSRFFPTRRKLKSMFKKYAVKAIGKSVAQAGDPLPREVFQIRAKLPVAILLMDMPYSGKTALSESVIREDIQRVSGDALYYDIMRGRRQAPGEIVAIIQSLSAGKDLNCAAVTWKIGSGKLLPKLCEVIQSITGMADFVLDMYISPPYREQMRVWWEARGFFVVDLAIYHARSHPHSQEIAEADICQRYMDYLKHDFLVNEADYLAANPDVARAVAQGRMPSAQAHYWYFGRRENRPLKPKED